MKGRIWTVPNQITFLRLGLSAAVSHTHVVREVPVALLVLVVAGLSDGIDGLLPAASITFRSRRVSRSHRDKLLSLLFFPHSGIQEAIGLVLRSSFLTATYYPDRCLLFACLGYRPFPPSIYGKSTTARKSSCFHCGSRGCISQS